MQTDSHEHVLLGSIEPMLALLRTQPDADRASIRKVVATLTAGMVFDLRTFLDEQSGRVVSLPTRGELDRYTYLVAGCVGEFWTDMTGMHAGRARLEPAGHVREGHPFRRAADDQHPARLREGPAHRPVLPADDVLGAHGRRRRPDGADASRARACSSTCCA